MKILSLCFCNNYFTEHENTLIDIKLGTDVLSWSTDQYYDIVFAAPPCDQFTKANAHHWEEKPNQYIDIAKKCLQLSLTLGQKFVLENPPGRIEKFIPELKKYRIITYSDYYSNKEYVLYSNVLLSSLNVTRYGKKNIHSWDKNEREMWTPGLIEMLKYNFNL